MSGDLEFEQLSSKLNYDPTVPSWYCEVYITGDTDPLAQGAGPDPLAAAMNCAESAAAQLTSAQGEPAVMLHPDYGWVALDVGGKIVHPAASLTTEDGHE